MSTTTSSPTIETLSCQTCGQDFLRERKRGVKPKNCPHCTQSVTEAKAQPTNEPRLQHLHCQMGHDWTRPAQRGKPPRYCPEHSVKAQPTIVQNSEGDESEVTTANAPTLKALCERFPNMDREDYFKLQYIDTILGQPRRRTDHEFTKVTQAHIISRLERRARESR